jgi:LPXTG-motif cell wall-anchored protein
MFFNTETNDWEVITGDDITVNDDGTITVNFPDYVDSSTQFAIVYDVNQNVDSTVDGVLGGDYDDNKQTTPIDSEQTTPIDSEQTTPTLVNGGSSNGEESTSTTTSTLVGDDSSNGEESTSTTKKSTKSKTGDDTPVVIYAGAGLVALVVVGALVYKGKKHN